MPTSSHLFLGVAWPYASGPRHVGHLAGAYLPADVVARASRLAGDHVLLVSGSDQYGTPITVAAEREGVPPQELADRNHEAIAATFVRAGITFDHYTKTSSPTHHRTVTALFERLHAGGFVVEGTQEVAWCPAHGRSLPDRYVEGRCPRCGAEGARGDQCDGCGATLEPADLVDPRCRSCGAPAELRPLRQLVLALDRLQPAVAAWLDRSRHGWSRPWVVEDALGDLRTGLRGRAITRDLAWGVGVPLPGWGDRRFYVWFDAVIGYLSATVEWAERAGRPDAWQRWWCGEGTTHRYYVGKDNVWFHALWWPAILLGASSADGSKRLHLPDDVVASHHLTEAGAQLSTSRGHGTTLDDAFDRWGVDPVRHAVASLAPESADVELTVDAVEGATRSGLLGGIANPAHRVASLWWRRFGTEAVPEPSAAETEAATAALGEVATHLRAARLRKGLAAVHAIGRTVNRRLAAEEPWKRPDDDARAGLAALLPWVDALAIAAWPIVPETAGNIRAALGRTPAPSSWALPDGPARLAGEPAPPLRAR
ncbi:MAG TPA: methionine--tRNA ligase [Acidimicrobiales bacterium]|nr:methionine--tRNA ligase [Acidimicrobiales bacterium]